MNSVAQNQKQNKRYLPHELNTRINAVKLYRLTRDLQFVLRRYHISKASLMRWNKLYDGTKESLADKSHRPHNQHPNAHTEEELNWIRNYHRRNPNPAKMWRANVPDFHIPDIWGNPFQVDFIQV